MHLATTVLPAFVLCLVLGLSDAYTVVCYYTNWASYRQGNAKFLPEDVDPKLCTHVIYSFAILDSSTYLMKPHDASLDINQGFYKKIVGLKQKNPELKTLIAIGGFTDSQSTKYSTMVGDPIRRQKFIQHALQFVKQHGFDGLDLDWEYPSTADKGNFATFAKELKAAFQPQGLLVTAAVSGAAWKIDEAYDVAALAKSLDYIHIMAYDFAGSWDGKTGHHAALYGDPFSDDKAVSYWMQKGAPANKLVLGMPMYGRTWTLANPSQNGVGAQTVGGGQAGPYTGEGGLLSYNEICSVAWTKIVSDPSGKMGPYAYKGNQWTSYDDPAMLKKKCDYVKQKGLAGAMVWALDQDDFNGKSCNQGRYPLLTAINQGLGRKSRRMVEDSRSFVCEHEGQIFPDPDNCAVYHVCHYGIPLKKVCPGILLFNPKKNACDFPENVEC